MASLKFNNLSILMPKVSKTVLSVLEQNTFSKILPKYEHYKLRKNCCNKEKKPKEKRTKDNKESENRQKRETK